MVVKHLDHLNVSVADLTATEDWYARVFGFRKVEGGTYDGRPWSILRSGDALLCCYEHPERKDPDPEVHGHHGLAHFGLRITDRASWEETMRRENVHVSIGPHPWPHSTAWYVSDPTGYEIEVACWDDDSVRF
jgi:catechol 2,3-dioxygenase-like lactoylglutathione lyase family enzyme